jgi:hypothetical protein
VTVCGKESVSAISPLSISKSSFVLFSTDTSFRIDAGDTDYFETSFNEIFDLSGSNSECEALSYNLNRCTYDPSIFSLPSESITVADVPFEE